MKVIQGKLSWLMLLVVFCAVAFAALKNPTPLVAALVWTGALTILMAAAIVGWVDDRSVFFKGVAVFGLGYAAFAAFDETTIMGRLRSTQLLSDLYERMNGKKAALMVMDVLVSGDTTILSSPSTRTNSFIHIGHGFFALIHGFAGGLFAVWIKSRIDNKRSPNIESTPDHE